MSYRIIDNRLYYFAGSEIRCLDLQSGEDTHILEHDEPIGAFYIDDDYYYIINSILIAGNSELSKLIIYDRQGNYVDTYNEDGNHENIQMYLFGDGKYLAAIPWGGHLGLLPTRRRRMCR